MNRLNENNQLKITEFNAANAALINQNEGAATLYNTYQQAVNAILNNPEMDEANKQAAIQLQFESLQAGMTMYSDVVNLNLGSILPSTPPSTTPPTTTPPGTTPPPTPPGGVGINPPPAPGAAPGTGAYQTARELATAQSAWDQAVSDWQPTYDGSNQSLIDAERERFLASLGPRPE